MYDTKNKPYDSPPRSKPYEDLVRKEAYEHSEGPVALTLEEQTAKLPSDVWLWASLAAMGIGLCLHATGRRHGGLLVGQWAAPFLLMGLYNKVVKTAGSDRLHPAERMAADVSQSSA